MNLRSNPTPAWRPSWLAVLAALAVGLVAFYYFMGESRALPVRLVPHLQAQPLALDSVAVGGGYLPVQVSGFVVSLTHDVAGPFTQPLVASAYLGLLTVLLAGWVAVVSRLRRTAFVAGMVPVIFLLLSLNTEELGVFGTTGRTFAYLLLAGVAGGGFLLHAFAERLSLAWRAVVMAALVAGLSGLAVAGSPLPPAETAQLLAAHATHAGALLLALVVLWVSIENVRALLWFNTQAERPESRFGLLPLIVATLLYLGLIFMYIWYGGTLQLLPGVNFDPLVLLLPALLVGGLGLRQRAPSYAGWVPYGGGMALLYPLVVMAAAGALAYAFATVNTPFLVTAREFTALALLAFGGVFLMYLLINFAPLIRQRLRVYKVVFEPRSLPFYTVYLMGLASLGVVQANQGVTWPDQVQAAHYNYLGDLARQQSEAHPDDLPLAVLAERYYAESGDVLYRSNLHAQLGRAALYRFRGQRQNEINALNRVFQRGPDERVSARLAALYNDPNDLFNALDVLRQGLQGSPRSAMLASDLAQLFTRTALTDSVATYLDKAEQLAPKSYVGRTNQLAFLLGQGLLAGAVKMAGPALPGPEERALASNLTLLRLQLAAKGTRPGAPVAVPDSAAFRGISVLDNASFAQVYHAGLAAAQARSAALLPVLARLGAHPANAAYYEQLVFVQALTQHAVGQELAARHLLAPLTAGTSAMAHYYQNLLGLWQLQQGQYLAAADQLDRAGLVDSSGRAAVRALAQQPAGAVAAGRPAPVGAAWLTQARQAEQAGQVAAATKHYQRIVRQAPFNEPAVLAAAAFFQRRKDAGAAYQALRAGLDENPHALPLLRAYVLAAADAGLPDYAADALAELRQQLPPAEYATLAAAYAAHRAAHAAAAASFSEAPPAPLLP